MPLTIRQDGSVVGGQPNTVVAQWWNDYHDLLTGLMTDQDVTLSTDLILKPMAALPAAPTAAAQAGTGLGIGVYQYAIVFTKAGQAGYSGLGTSVSVTTTSGNQAVGLSSIPLGPAGTSGRLIYRTQVGGSSFYYVATLGNNTATTYVDTTPDASLASPPNPQAFGGALVVNNAGGVSQAILFNDGHLESFISSAAMVATQKSAYMWRGTAGTAFVGIFDISPSDAGQKHWMLAYNGGDQHIQFQNVTDGIDALDIDTGGNILVHGSLTVAGVASSAEIFQQGSPIALTGSHSAGQIAVSYGAGVPASLGSNEIYFQIS